MNVHWICLLYVQEVLFGSLTYKMGQDFLDIQYVSCLSLKVYWKKRQFKSEPIKYSIYTKKD